MKHRLLWVMVASAALPLGALAAELNTLSDVQVVGTSKGAQVVVSGSKAPTFTVFRLSDPDRLVVDLASADASAIKGHKDGAGPVSGVVTSQFSDARASVARVLVALAAASQYDVRADGKRVVISVDGQAPTQTVASAPATPAVATAPAAVPPVAVAITAPAEIVEPVKVSEPAAAPPATVRAEERRPENVVAVEQDEREVRNPARSITGLALGRAGLNITTDGEVSRYELLELTDPPRLALDVFGVGLKARAPRARTPTVQDIRVGAHGEKVRIVLDVAGQMPKYAVVRSKGGLRLTLTPVAAPAPAPQEVAPAVARNEDAEIEIDGKRMTLAELAPVPVKPEPATSTPPAADRTAAETRPAKLAQITALQFVDALAGGTVELKIDGAPEYSVDRPDGESAVLTLAATKIPKKLERSLDTSALETPVKMVSAFAVPGGVEKVRIVVAAQGKLDQKVVRTTTGISWKLTVAVPAKEEVAVAPKTAGFTAEGPAYAEQGAPTQTSRYRGKRVSFEFKDIDIHNLLRVIAEISKRNIVVADDVKGTVTIRLRNVPWDQALELILRSKGLGKEELGNIIRVAPLKQLEEEAKVRAERKAASIRQEELVVQLLPVNYARASEMASRVKDVLTNRGSVTVDERTNVLIVKEVGSNIGRARALVQNLDTQTPQVLIESRIVEANTNFTRELGVQWGGLAQAAPATGNATGLIFPNTVSVRGGTEQSNTVGVADAPNWAVNLPAGAGQGSGGALGFHFGSAGGALQLNLRLSALENQGHVKTISAPKVTTLDNNTARISQGISIPFTSVSANGINVLFIEARLALEVTPHITQDGSVLMAIKAENNQPDPSLTGANGQPSILRKEANTQVLVKDGDTTVIGGIYVRRGASSTSSLPFLGKIPILGFLFRNDSEVDERQELLIFITPRIINRQTISQSL